MKLIKLKLVNYRRFIEPVTIDFAHEDNENVTIIRAENGAGKTGIMTALLFGLFGETEYNQFNLSTEQDDIIINRQVLKENKSATASVEIHFFDEGEEHIIKRSISGTCISNVMSQDTVNIKSEMIRSGLSISSDSDEINRIMADKIGENIRNFLFFDGVKYVNLFQRDYKQYKKELQNIIEKLLNINDLDDTIKRFKAIETSYNSSSKSQYSYVLSKCMNELKTLEDYKDEVSLELEGLEKRLQQVEIDEKEFEKKLRQHEEHEEDYKKFRELKETIDNQSRYIKELTLNVESKAIDAYKQMFRTTVGEEIIGELRKLVNGENIVGATLIKSILNSNQCICNRELTQKEVDSLKNLLSKIESGDILDVNYIAIINKLYDEMTETNPNFDSYFSSKYDELNKEIEDFEQSNLKLTDFSSDLETLLSEAGEIHTEKGSISERKKKLKEEMSNKETEYEQILIDIDEKDKEKDNILKKQAAEKGELDKYNFISNTRKKLEKLRHDYLEITQKNISDKSNIYFKKLLSKEDNAAIKSLNITKDYRIKVLNHNNNEVFSQLSAGQKHLAAMAFTMGLTAVSTETKPDYHFPLVMDTPFSNLDLANRKRLISLMPTIVNQWILTPMDTEMTDNEIEFFETTSKVGQVYELVKNEGITSLIPHTHINELKKGNKNG